MSEISPEVMGKAIAFLFVITELLCCVCFFFFFNARQESLPEPGITT